MKQFVSFDDLSEHTLKHRFHHKKKRSISESSAANNNNNNDETIKNNISERESAVNWNNNHHNNNFERNSSTTVKVEWTEENELIMVEWCDVAQCYKWMNSRAHSKYARMHAYFTIPAIIFSTISGTASFAQSSLSTKMQVYSPLFIGTINIMIGIFTTIQQYLKISEMNEAHRVSSIAWDKFARNIRIELAKSPDERNDAGQFLKVCRNEYDRLMETSPSIPSKIITEFNSIFKGKEGTTERERFNELNKPDICNIIISANHYRYDRKKNQNIFNKQQEKEEEQTRMFEFLKKQEEIKNIKNTQKMTIEKYKEKEKLEKQEQINAIEKYIQTFTQLYERKPFTDEIKNNFKHQKTSEVSEEAIENYLKTINTDENV